MFFRRSIPASVFDIMVMHFQVHEPGKLSAFSDSQKQVFEIACSRPSKNASWAMSAVSDSDHDIIVCEPENYTATNLHAFI